MSGPRLYVGKSGARMAPSLPVDAVTRTIAVLGQRGTGKTNTAVVICEEIARRGGHVAVLDPVGAWYGITRKGEKQGIPGIVIGGEHGDVPLEEGAGSLVAELVVGRHWPVVVIDMKLLRKGAQLRFMADYLEGLFHSNREPLMQVFEEADRALPQTGRNFDVVAARVLGAGEDIIKLGRSRGLGGLLVTQRTASVNKNVLEVCEALALHRLMGPNDRKAIKGWVESNGDPHALKVVMDSMASLKQGEAWLYAPGWLGEELPATRRPDQPAAGLVRLRVRKRHTFDSSRTPVLGERVVEPTSRAPVDLDELRARMAETVQRQRENDPRELRKRIAALEQQHDEAGGDYRDAIERIVREWGEPMPARTNIADVVLDMKRRASEPREVEVKVAVPDPAAAADVREALEAIASTAASLGQMVESVEHVTGVLGASLEVVSAVPAEGRPVGNGSAPARDSRREGAAGSSVGETEAPASRRSTPLPPPGDRSNGRTGPEQRVLDALAWWHHVGVRAPSRLQVAMVAGYHERTKSYTNALGSLNTAGRVRYPTPGHVELTSEGRDEAAHPARPGTTRELQEMVLRQVTGVPGRVLRELLSEPTHIVGRATLAERLGYHERTKSFTNALGRLRSLGFVVYPSPGTVHVSDVLFVEGR